MTFVDYFNLILGVSTVIGQIYVVAVLICISLEKGNDFLGFVSKHILAIILVPVFLALFGSLMYSDVIGYDACMLCWAQRVLMYPQVLLVSMAMVKKDRKIIDYILALSGVGALIALYHSLLQFGLVPALACDAVGSAVSCSQRFVMQFGYITIPMMSLTIFLVVVASIIATKSVDKKQG